MTTPCPPNSIGALAGVGGAAGSMVQFHNTSMFVAQPNVTVKVGLLGFPDIFGLDSGRTKSDAEALAKLGYAIAVVDMADGDYLTPETMADLPNWRNKFTFDEVLAARVQDGIEYLRSEFDVESIATYGYCWGAWVNARQSALPDPIIKGAVSFHPSWATENVFNGDGAVEKMVERISVPQVLMAAGNDPAFVRENGTVIQILAGKPETSEYSKAIDFPDMAHGWVHRGNLSDPAVEAAVDKAWHEAIEFFRKVAPQ
uniref:Dienelactone hydrolase domain-containing protein n=1 Tax=Globisporangium ultimum (strain ATCC 200006 / CBS 805.95 / DAOM BR144) TaxID=431595 RepID=K3WXS1_GLOUD